MKTRGYRLNNKSQTTVPKVVREKLDLGAGDQLRYLVEHDRVFIEKVIDEAEEIRFATFTEWASEADQKAFRSL